MSTKTVAQLEAARDKITTQIENTKAGQKIRCACCQKLYAIGSLTAIQTYWIDEDCDSHRGELQFLCPKTGIRNRLMFDNNDVPWPERNEYRNNPEDQFILKYSSLFGETKKVSGKQSLNFVNNYFVDENRAKFGLVERSVKK